MTRGKWFELVEVGVRGSELGHYAYCKMIYDLDFSCVFTDKDDLVVQYHVWASLLSLLLILE